MARPDTPFALMLEMGVVLFGGPMLILLAATGLVVSMRPWRFPSGREAAFKLAMGGIVVMLALLLSWRAFLLGFGTLLEHPRYRTHVVCDPCF
ncbi:hypothetical protein [Mesorhizobium sp. WSM2239]|uniref:Uncharacterized protein n=2 Tax=unclassified Mesorhizobium TaxID=325217 RepID=A0AAU8DFM0_9HYPH